MLKSSDVDNWHNVRDVALFSLALDTGLRIGEVVGLPIDRLEIDRYTIRLEDTKTGEDRIVCFSDEAGQLLARWLEVRQALPVETAACFVSDSMGALTDSGIRQRLDFWLTKAGLGHFNFHRLRNSYAVYALRARADLLDVQRQLGHANIATTQRYVAVDDVGRAARHQAANPLGYLAGI
jgi:site-specific recombinase XerD